MLPTPLKALDENQLLDAAVTSLINGRCRRAYLHDVRGGLQALSGALELLARLARTGKSDPVLVDRASAIARSALANHEGAIVEMLKQVVPEEELAGPVDFGELLDETLRFLRNDIACKQITVSVDRCDELEVLAAKHQLRLLLLALLTQRIDDCPTGAEFSLRLERAGNLAVFAMSSLAAPHPDPESSDARPSREPIYPGRAVFEWASSWLSRNGGRMELTRAEHSARSECRVYYPLRVMVPHAPAAV